MNTILFKNIINSAVVITIVGQIAFGGCKPKEGEDMLPLFGAAAGLGAGSSSANIDAAPVAGDTGNILFTGSTGSAVTLTWTAGTDDKTAVPDLTYQVYYSLANDITSVLGMESNGTPFGSADAGKTAETVSGLIENTTYYFNILVSDGAGNKAAYLSNSKATLEGTVPTPGNGGNFTLTGSTGSTLTVSWTSGTDNLSTPANLEYLVYYSTSNNISTVADMETNGTPVGSYTAALTSTDVTGLNDSTVYYLNIIVKDEAGNKTAYNAIQVNTTDITSSVPGNSGNLNFTGSTASSVSLSWTAATDGISAAANLTYQVYYSTSNNISTVAEMETNGTTFGAADAGKVSETVTGLTSSTEYYFNILVTDEAANKAAYVSNNSSTLDISAPTPGGGGSLASTGSTGTSISFSWAAAIDDVTAQNTLEYMVYYSTLNNITTVSDAETNGTSVGAYTSNMVSKTVSGLAHTSSYYVNVIVRDTAGNKTIYNSVALNTTDMTASVPGGSGAISFTGSTASSVSLSWVAATDVVSVPANLTYQVYYSTSNNIGTVAEMEANGTTFGTADAAKVAESVSGLTSSTTYYFNILVTDEAGNKAAYASSSSSTLDITAPTPGNSGSIGTTGSTATSLTVAWTAATDDVTTQATLEYQLYYSTANNITTVADAEANGTPFGVYTADLTGATITGLSHSTAYYVNVVVRDDSGNKSAYNAALTNTPDNTPPIPGGGGVISSGSEVFVDGISISWVAASDGVTPTTELQYQVYYSSANNIDTVANAEANGTPPGTYTTNLTSATVTGLTPSTTYYLTVVVMDANGNKAVYQTLMSSTATGDWVQDAFVQPVSLRADIRFGNVVAISGNYAVVGSEFENRSSKTILNTDNLPILYTTISYDVGAAWILKRDPATGDWIQDAHLKASNAQSYDLFGKSASISGDYVVVGAPGESNASTTIVNTDNATIWDSSLASDTGAAYIYKRDSVSGDWSQDAYLKASNAEAVDEFGRSVSISGDYVAVGAGREDNSSKTIVNADDATITDVSFNEGTGAVYIYKRDSASGDWSQDAYLKASNAGNADYFGSSISISGDYVVVGAAWENNPSTTIVNTDNATITDLTASASVGAAYIFKRDPATGNWIQDAYLKASNTTMVDLFGYSVSISGDYVTVGSHNEDNASTTIVNTDNPTITDSATLTDSGAAYVFKRDTATGDWIQDAYLKASNAGGADVFGRSVSISGDHVVVAAYNEDNGSTTIVNTDNATISDSGTLTDSGAVYVYKRDSATGDWIQDAYFKGIISSEWYGHSVAIDNKTVIVGVPKGDQYYGYIENADNTAPTSKISDITDPGYAYIYKMQ